MKMLTSQDFRRLAEAADGPCVSLLMPAHRSGPETAQDPIRFKNLLREAEDVLTDRGQRAADVREWLHPLRQLIDDESFWAHQREGLAAFRLAEETSAYGVPFSLPERIAIGPRPYLVPLIPIVSEDAPFYVLALSPKQVRLFAGTRHTAREIDLPGWPEDFEQLAVHIEEQSQLQFHTEAQTARQFAGRGESGGSTDRAAMFHGHSAGEESAVRKQRLLEYSRLIDERLKDAVGFDRTPLVLACDERLAPIFRNASEYPHVVERPVAGNPDRSKADELCRKAWEIVQPEVEQAREAALSRFGAATGKGRTAGRLDAVLPAADEGRVDTLLVAAGAERWGRFDPEQRRLDVHDRPEPDDEELVNLAMIRAFRQGAAVHVLPQDRMPGEEQAAAVLRY